MASRNRKTAGDKIMQYLPWVALIVLIVLFTVINRGRSLDRIAADEAGGGVQQEIDSE